MFLRRLVASCCCHGPAVSDEKSRQLGPVAADLLGHVVSVLEDDQSREAHGQAYTQILCRLLEVLWVSVCVLFT